MLPDDRGGIDGDDLSSGEGPRDGLDGPFVVGWLSVGGNQNPSIEDDEIGVGGWQAEAFFIDGVGHGQWEQLVRFSFERPQL